MVSANIMIRSTEIKSVEERSLERTMIEFNCKYIKKFWVKIIPTIENLKGNIIQLTHHQSSSEF